MRSHCGIASTNAYSACGKLDDQVNDLHWNYSINAVAAVDNAKGGKAKIRQLDMAIMTDQQILRLHITVYDTLQ